MFVVMHWNLWPLKLQSIFRFFSVLINVPHIAMANVAFVYGIIFKDLKKIGKIIKNLQASTIDKV